MSYYRFNAPTQEVTVIRFLIIMLLVVADFGCRMRQEKSPVSATGDPSGFESGAQTSVPMLSSNEVMLIAHQIVRTNSFRLDNYVCKAVGFGANSPDPNISNKWVVRFAPESETPDADVFVIVDDTTRKAILWRWANPQQ